eukprot:1144357-Pelagomonas_calceolata.AAC.2
MQKGILSAKKGCIARCRWALAAHPPNQSSAHRMRKGDVSNMQLCGRPSTPFKGQVKVSANGFGALNKHGLFKVLRDRADLDPNELWLWPSS